MTKKILIVMAHPRKDSLSEGFAQAYKRGAEKAGAEIRYVDLVDQNLNLVFNDHSFWKDEPIDKNTKQCQEDITWADHIVYTYPIWWGMPPALLKGYFDTVYLSGFAYKYKSTYRINRLLKGKSVRCIQTGGAPGWITRILMGTPFHNYAGEKSMKMTLFTFCGMSPVKFTRFQRVYKHTPKEKIQGWLDKVEKLGMKMK